MIGDDEEANSPPYPEYDIIHTRATCREAFVLPLSLAAYLSRDDFKDFQDGYGNTYGGNVIELPATLAGKLSQAVGLRRAAGPPVFLSYAREDVAVARRLFKSLSDQGLHIWLDETSLMPGQRGFVQKELLVALEVFDELPPSATFLIPVRAEPCRPEHSALNDRHGVDLFPDFDFAVHRLAGVIRSLGS